MSFSVKRSVSVNRGPSAFSRACTPRMYAIVVASAGNHPTSGPHSVVMLEMESRASIESDATPGPANSTAAFKHSSWL